MHDYDAYCDKPGKLHLPELGYRFLVRLVSGLWHWYMCSCVQFTLVTPTLFNCPCVRP